jgi:hypothetical protein
LDDEAMASSRSFCSDECATSVHIRDQVLYDRLMMNVRNRASRIKANAAAAPRQCAECGRSYRSANPDQRFCSQKCANAARSYLTDRNCLWCGKLFRPKDDTKRCCSFACATKIGARTRAQNLPEVTCPICHDVFRKRTAVGKYCSAACKSVADNAARRLPERIGRCEECGAAFIRKRSDKRWCGVNCRARAGARRRAETLPISGYFCEAAE